MSGRGRVGRPNLSIGALSTQLARASDESDLTEIKLRAPLEDANCTDMVITVLGRTIDIRNASIAASMDADGSALETQGTECAALVPGQAVEVTLSAASDTTLTAREVDQEGEDDGIEIEAPIQQAVDQTIQILGLSVDVSQASFGGSRDDDNEDSDQPVSQTDLMTGQFVKLKLPSSTPPFVASQVRGENFSNQVEVEVDDSDDQPVDDDLQVEVVEKLTVQQNTAASSAHPKKVVLHFSRSARGTFTLSGLPTGKAKIFVSSAASGGLMAGRRGVKVSGNTMQTVHIRLQKRPSQ